MKTLVNGLLKPNLQKQMCDVKTLLKPVCLESVTVVLEAVFHRNDREFFAVEMTPKNDPSTSHRILRPAPAPPLFPIYLAPLACLVGVRFELISNEKRIDTPIK